MKVLFVDHNAISSSGRVLYRELSNLPEMEVTVLAPRIWRDDFGESRLEREIGPLSVRSSRTLFAGRSHRVLYLSLKSVLRQMRPEILYVNSEPEGYLAWQAVTLREAVSPHTKVVFDSWRNMDYGGRKFPYKLAWFNALAERRVLSTGDHCIAHNEAAKEIFRQKGFEKVTVIPPAVDTNLFRKEKGTTSRDALGLRGFTIGYIGRFIAEKGVDFLLKAVRELPFEYRILLVGDGPAKKLWTKLAEDLGIGRRVLWTGAVQHSKVPFYLNAMDVLILPSFASRYWKEQFGRILIEAMACEVPVVGSSSGEIPSVIGEAGVVFREGDVDDLRRSLVELHANPSKRLDFAANGLEKVKKRYSVAVVARQYYDLFTSLSNPTKA